MSLYKGEKLTVEIFGESHAEKIGALVSGMPETTVDFDRLNNFLERRKSNGFFSTPRREGDVPVFEGITGNTVKGEYSFYIKNENVKSSDYNALYGKPRPSHADYAWHLKDGVLDFKGGGRFSGRLTAPLCVVGGICLQHLEKYGIKIAAFVSEIGGVTGKSYKTGDISVDEIIKDRDGFPSLSDKEKMIEKIARAKEEGDSVGGKIECVISGLKGGFGDNLFGGLEGKISNLLFSVPAVKGVEFGLGFGFCKKNGSRVNDGLYYDDGKVKFYSNNSGGINGGISNGADITFSVAIRPTPSISMEQATVDLVNKKNVKIKISGRHDACIVPRAVPCIESAAAIALTDLLG